MALLDMQGMTRADACGDGCDGGFGGGFGGGFPPFGGGQFGFGVPINLSLCSFTFCPVLF